MAVFGFLTEGDLTPLKDQVSALEFEVKLVREKNEKLTGYVNVLTDRIMSLEKYSYNMGGDLATLKRQVSKLQEDLARLQPPQSQQTPRFQF